MSLGIGFGLLLLFSIGGTIFFFRKKQNPNNENSSNNNNDDDGDEVNIPIRTLTSSTYLLQRSRDHEYTDNYQNDLN